MGTEVHFKSYLPGYYSMRDINEDSNSSSWSLFYGEKTSTNGQYYNGYMPRTVTDAYPGYDKDVLKQKMLEHEAIFKNQVYELHRLYRIQRDMMEEVKRKERHKHLISNETSSPSSLLRSQMPSEDSRKWHIPSFPLVNGCARTSLLGAEIIDSPLSCTKGNSTQASQGPSQNGCTSKDCEVLESRPSKVRKKLFDLQLPAEEYIDSEEEQFQDNKISDILSFPPDGVRRISPERSVNLFNGGSGKIDCPGDKSTSGSCLRSSLGLADLNEPIQVEAATASTSVDFLVRSACPGEIRGLDLSDKPKSEFLGLSQEFLQNFQHGSNHGTLNNPTVENTGNGIEWLSYMYEAGNSKRNLNSVPKCLHPDKLSTSSHSTRLMFNKANQPRGIFPSDQSREVQWRERTARDVDISDRSHDHCHPEPLVPSRISNPYPFVNSSDLANSWSNCVSSWGKPSSSFVQKLASVQTHPSFNSSATLSRNSQSSDQSHEIFGGKWHVNGSRSNPGLASEVPKQNGFCQGSSSGSKELSVCFPSSGFDYRKYKKGDNAVSECVIDHGSEKFFKGSNFMDLTSANDMNLNVVPKNSSNEEDTQQDLEIIDEKSMRQDHLAVLPWLRAKPARNNEATDTRRDLNSGELGFLQASSNQLGKNETLTGPKHIFTQNVTLALRGHDGGAKEIGDSLANRTILGFPIFENPSTSKTDSSSLGSTSGSLHCPPDGEDLKNKGKHRVIDINVACDPMIPESGKHIAAEPLVLEKETENKVANFRNHIDLNFCMSEDEDPLIPSLASISANMKIAVEIDLEAPIVPESEEAVLPGEEHKQHEAPVQLPQHKSEPPQDEFVRTAAEAIVSISSSGQHHHMEDTTCHPSEASVVDSFLWFVEVVSSCTFDLDKNLDKESRAKCGADIEEFSSCEIDEFEALTLQLTETKEEDYMPKPLVPDIREVEETGATTLPNRSRRGLARRGRQRRDFQKDILPGLTSLSRHEVTEDLQVFGGLMRATGHPWQSGLTRRNGTRNGAARGRRRLVVEPAPPVLASPVSTPLMQQLNNIEVGLEDRSLTGWGKTTRRPRRQRCPAGNPLAVALT